MCSTSTFLLISHVSVASPPAKHPFNDPSTGLFTGPLNHSTGLNTGPLITGLISTRCPGSPLQGSTQVSTVIARGSDHLLNYSPSNVKSLRCFLFAIYTTKDRCPVEAQLLAFLKTNFFLFPLKTVCAGWKLP